MSAGNATIGALRVVLGADSAQFETGMKQAQKTLQDFSNKVQQAGKIAAAGFAMAAAGLAVAMKGSINQADELFKASQKFGVPIEELSKLKYAADLSGVSLETLGKSLSKLSRNMMEAAANPAGEAAQAFAALGINVRNADGTLKGSSAVLQEIAGKFANFKDGAAKTALAIALFGRAGADMIPMLNLGKQGLQEMSAEAEQLGLVIDARTGAAAEAFNDNLTRMRRVFDGIVIKITAEMLPAFLQFSKVLVEVAKNQNIMKAAAEGVISIVKGAVTVVLTLVVTFKRLAAEISAVWEMITLFGKGEFSKGLEVYKKAGIETEETFKNLSQFVEAFYKTAKSGAEELAKKPPPPNEAPIIQANKDALDKYIDSVKKKNAALQADLQTVGLSEAAHARLKIILEGEAIAKDNNIKLTDAMRAKLLEAANANASLVESLERSKEQWDNFRGVVLNVRSSLENAFTDAITRAKSLKDVVRSLVGEFARLASQQAFRSMFGSAADWTSAAGGAASGGGGIFASLGKLFNFAQGGSFQVGGSGGIDSQLVAFKASPNERVTVTKPGQDMGGGITVIVNPVAHFQAGMTPTDMAVIRSMEAQWAQQVKNETINTIRGMSARDSRAFAL